MAQNDICLEHIWLLQRHGRPQVPAVEKLKNFDYDPTLPLSKEGLEEVKRVNRARDTAGFKPNLIMHSNCKRVLETAQQSVGLKWYVPALSHKSLCGLSAGPAIIDLYRRGAAIGLNKDSKLEDYLWLPQGEELLLSWASMTKLVISERLRAKPTFKGSKILVVGHAVLIQALALEMVDKEIDPSGRESLCRTPFRPAEIMVVHRGEYLGTICVDGCHDPL